SFPQRPGIAFGYNLAGGTPTVPVFTMQPVGLAVGDNFGNSVALSNSRLVVGSPRDNAGASSAGAAYVYNVGSPTPSTVALVLTNPAPSANELFGSSVAISDT